MKQTAVQWLESELHKLGLDFTFDHPDSIFRKTLDEALEMEKEQIIKAYYKGTEQFDVSAEIVRPKTPQQYYSETYENETE